MVSAERATTSPSIWTTLSARRRSSDVEARHRQGGRPAGSGHSGRADRRTAGRRGRACGGSSPTGAHSRPRPRAAGRRRCGCDRGASEGSLGGGSRKGAEGRMSLADVKARAWRQLLGKATLVPSKRESNDFEACGRCRCGDARQSHAWRRRDGGRRGVRLTVRLAARARRAHPRCTIVKGKQVCATPKRGSGLRRRLRSERAYRTRCRNWSRQRPQRRVLLAAEDVDGRAAVGVGDVAARAVVDHHADRGRIAALLQHQVQGGEAVAVLGVGVGAQLEEELRPPRSGSI